MAKLKIKLTPLQIEERKARDQLTYITNKVKGLWSFGKLKSFKDLLQSYGADTSPYFPSELNELLTFQRVKDFLDDKRIELSTYYWLKNNPPDLSKQDYESETHPSILEAIKPDKEELFSVEKELNAKEWAERLPKVKRSRAFLFWFQKKAACQVIEAIQRGDRATFLVAAPGAGKTFIAAYVLAWLIESKHAEGKTYSPWPRIYVTKPNVVEQTARVLEKFFGIKEDECLVVGLDSMRATFGKRFVKETIQIIQGEEHYKWEWIKNLAPVEIFWDEAHSLKNVGSKQSKIGQAYNDIDWGNIHTFQLFISASPGSKVCEFKCFCVATQVPYTFGIQKDAPLTNAHWSDFANNIASDNGRLDVAPEDRSPGAINRLMNYMDKYIVRVKGVRWQFNAQNHIRVIDFETEAGRKEYTDAWEKFLEEKAKIEGDDSMTNAQSTFNILAQLTVFLKAAESNSDRVNILTRESYRDVQEGFAAVIAVRNKITICKIVCQLIEKYGVSRDQISLIWGGAPKATKRQKLKKNLLGNEAVMKVFEEEGITLNDIDLDDIDVVPDNQYPKHYRLGNQSRIERQKEIDRFQQGKSLYCLYTYRAGGVGLSLHHCDEWMTKYNELADGFNEWFKELQEWNTKNPLNRAAPGKVRRKEDSGYAFEEDIPFINTRQRVVRMPPCWSPIDAVQGTGRVPRLTSLSNTPQYMLYFKGTVEERQARVMSVALHCLSKVVRNKEHWEDLIIGRKGMTDDELENELVKAGTVDKIQNETYHDDDYNEEDEEEEEE